MDILRKNMEQRRQNDLSFFGKIMANVSHEFNNVITIIGELSGLLQDLTILAEKGKPIKPEKLRKITENIARHVARGKELISNMNRFAHSVDEPELEFDVRDVAENMHVLTSRLIDRRQAKFHFETPEEDIRITADPFAFRHALFACLEMLMKASSDTLAIDMSIQPGAKNVNILLQCDANGDFIEKLPEWHMFLELVKDSGGRVVVSKEDSRSSIQLTIPKSSEVAR